ncbi:MAG: Shedu anti-phage system protein SduA domain-containing protein [Myxococcota bacterium]
MREFTFKKASWEDFIREHPIYEFHLDYQKVSAEETRGFERCVDAAADEAPIQAYLEAHPGLLALHLRASGRFVLPQKRLGAEFIPDFVIGEHHSFGYDWQLVELENPTVPLFTRAGDPRAELTHAIRQIQDWRAWLHRNQNYASRPRREQGLGLTDITAGVPGLIFMGRRESLDDSTRDRRRQMGSELNIRIHTYDYLLEWARGAVRAS